MNTTNKIVLGVAAACMPIAVLAAGVSTAAAAPTASPLPSGNGWWMTGNALDNLQCSIQSQNDTTVVVKCSNIPVRDLPQLAMHTENDFWQIDVKSDDSNPDQIEAGNAAEKAHFLNSGQTQHFVDKNLFHKKPWGVYVNGFSYDSAHNPNTETVYFTATHEDHEPNGA